MSWLSSWMHPGRAYDKGIEQAKQYYDQAQGYQQPYNQNAQDQYGNLNTGITSLMDPQALYDKWSSGYNESDAAKQTEAMASQHGLDAASSMGIMGSTPALSAIQSGTAGIVAQDKQQYLQDLMNKYTTGINAAQGVYNTGANAAGQMSNTASNMGNTMSQAAAQKQQAGGNLFGQSAGMIGKMIANYLSGGIGSWNPGGA